MRPNCDKPSRRKSRLWHLRFIIFASTYRHRLYTRNGLGGRMPLHLSYPKQQALGHQYLAKSIPNHKQRKPTKAIDPVQNDVMLFDRLPPRSQSRFIYTVPQRVNGWILPQEKAGIDIHPSVKSERGRLVHRLKGFSIARKPGVRQPPNDHSALKAPLQLGHAPIPLPTLLPTHQPIYLPTHQPTYLLTHQPIYLLTHQPTYLLTL
jgi:hypothetical protein